MIIIRVLIFVISIVLFVAGIYKLESDCMISIVAIKPTFYNVRQLGQGKTMEAKYYYAIYSLGHIKQNKEIGYSQKKRMYDEDKEILNDIKRKAPGYNEIDLAIEYLKGCAEYD